MKPPPCLPVVFAYPRSKITIGGWSITRRKDGPVFSFFVKPKTRTYEWLKDDDEYKVYIDEDIWTYAKKIDKVPLTPNGLWIEGHVIRIVDVDEYKLVECRIENYIEPDFFLFNEGVYIEKIGTIKRRR